MDPGKIFQVYICTIQDMIVYLLVTAKEELLHHLSLLTEGPMDKVTLHILAQLQLQAN